MGMYLPAFSVSALIITKELDQRLFNQEAYERRFLRKELAAIARAKKMGKGKSEYYYGSWKETCSRR